VRFKISLETSLCARATFLPVKTDSSKIPNMQLYLGQNIL